MFSYRVKVDQISSPRFLSAEMRVAACFENHHALAFCLRVRLLARHVLISLLIFITACAQTRAGLEERKQSKTELLTYTTHVHYKN